MRIAVVGASGRTGGTTVAHALAAGHEVISVVRNPAKAPAGTTIAQADARDAAALARAFSGVEGVVSCVGHVSGDANEKILQESAAAVVEAMSASAVQRLIVVSASGAFVAGDDPLARFVAKPLLERILKANNVDIRAMEAVIRASSTNWTLLRPSRLIKGEGSATYRRSVDTSVRWHYNTRFDTVGRAAVDALGRPEWIGHAVFITE